MSRIRPIGLRISSATLNTFFTGTSEYYFVNQFKQNLTLNKTIKLLSKQLLFPKKINTIALKAKESKDLLQPALLPATTFLRAKQLFAVQFIQSKKRFKRVSLSCAKDLYERFEHCFYNVYNFDNSMHKPSLSLSSEGSQRRCRKKKIPSPSLIYPRGKVKINTQSETKKIINKIFLHETKKQFNVSTKTLDKKTLFLLNCLKYILTPGFFYIAFSAYGGAKALSKKKDTFVDLPTSDFQKKRQRMNNSSFAFGGEKAARDSVIELSLELKLIKTVVNSYSCSSLFDKKICIFYTSLNKKQLSSVTDFMNIPGPIRSCLLNRIQHDIIMVDPNLLLFRTCSFLRRGANAKNNKIFNHSSDEVISEDFSLENQITSQISPFDKTLGTCEQGDVVYKTLAYNWNKLKHQHSQLIPKQDSYQIKEQKKLFTNELFYSQKQKNASITNLSKDQLSGVLGLCPKLLISRSFNEATGLHLFSLLPGPDRLCKSHFSKLVNLNKGLFSRWSKNKIKSTYINAKNSVIRLKDAFVFEFANLTVTQEKQIAKAKSHKKPLRLRKTISIRI